MCQVIGHHLEYAAQLPCIIEPYSIPLRCLYSRNIENLLMAGRDFSCAHIGLGSPRLILTCAVMGQAAGTAASFCIHKSTTPRGVAHEHIAELQQTLLKDDCFIPTVKNEDPADLARCVHVTGTSSAILALEPLPDSVALADPRSQIVPITADHVNTLWLHLESSSSDPQQVCVELCPVSSLWEYNEAPPSPPVVATATVPPRSVGWVACAFNAATTPGLHRVNVSSVPEVAWSQAQPEPGVASFWRRDSWKRWVPGKAAFAMRIEPRAKPFGPENVINGVARPQRWTNIWISDPSQQLPQMLFLDIGAARSFNTVYLTFDTYLHLECRAFPGLYRVPQCVAGYAIKVERDGTWHTLVEEQGNYHRRRVHRFDRVTTQRLAVEVRKTNGDPSARIYEVRVYDE